MIGLGERLRAAERRRLMTWEGTAVIVAGGLAAAAVLAIVFFDFGPRLPFNDDYVYSWSARHLGTDAIYPRQTALALPQLVIGWLLSLPFSHDEHFLRLSTVPLMLGGAWAAYRLAQRLGAGSFWSLISPVVILTSPIFFNLATSFMSDVTSLSLFVLACNAGVAWIEGGRGRAGFALWATLATVQRVDGIGLVAALAIILLIRARRTGQWPRSDTGWLAIAVIGSLVAIALPVLLGTASGSNVVDRLGRIQVDALPAPLGHLPVVGGLLLLPLAGAVSVRWNRRLAVVGIPVAALVLLALAAYDWVPGNIWTLVGPSPTLGGTKTAPVPVVLELVLLVLCPLVFWVLAAAGSQEWLPAVRSDQRFAFLLLVSGIQLVLLIPNTVTLVDRYYLPVVVPLIPILCALGQRRGGLNPVVLAVVTCAVTLGLSVVYEQDYQSWQAARDQAARMAYRCAAPADVNAGYEANALYVEIPAYEANKKSLIPKRLVRDPTLFGPLRPVLWLEFAGPTDPRPGVTYESFAPGRIVINGSGCPQMTAAAAAPWPRHRAAT